MIGAFAPVGNAQATSALSSTRLTHAASPSCCRSPAAETAPPTAPQTTTHDPFPLPCRRAMPDRPHRQRKKRARWRLRAVLLNGCGYLVFLRFACRYAIVRHSQLSFGARAFPERCRLATFLTRVVFASQNTLAPFPVRSPHLALNRTFFRDYLFESKKLILKKRPSRSEMKAITAEKLNYLIPETLRTRPLESILCHKGSGPNPSILKTLRKNTGGGVPGN